MISTHALGAGALVLLLSSRALAQGNAALAASTSACDLAPVCSGTPLAPSFVFAPSGTPCTDNGGTMCNATGMCL